MQKSYYITTAEGKEIAISDWMEGFRNPQSCCYGFNLNCAHWIPSGYISSRISAFYVQS